jgi:hypothetical protein
MTPEQIARWEWGAKPGFLVIRLQLNKETVAGIVWNVVDRTSTAAAKRPGDLEIAMTTGPCDLPTIVDHLEASMRDMGYQFTSTGVSWNGRASV